MRRPRRVLYGLQRFFLELRAIAVGQILLGGILAVLLVVVAWFYIRRSIRTLQTTTPAFEMLPNDRRFLRRQSWRRLVNSGFMLLLAVLLAGWYATGINDRADELAAERVAQRVDGKAPPMTELQKERSRFFAGYVIAMLSVLFTVVMLAGLDLLATRLYGLRELRQINADRRAMLARQLNRWRQERNGGPFADE